jgi:monoamine oxidase
MNQDQPFSPLTRRQFLRCAGLFTGAALTTSLLRDLDALAQLENRCTLSLSVPGWPVCAPLMNWKKRGHSVQILEAEPSHIGGRARTLRFGNGLYGEAGAMRIPLRHEITRHYVKEFGVPLRPFVQSNPQAYYYLRGQRLRIADVKNINRLYALTEGERTKTPDDLWNEVVIRRLEALSDAERADLSSVGWTQPLFGRSISDRCSSCASVRAVSGSHRNAGRHLRLGNAAIERRDEHLREEREQVWAQQFHEIVGGTDRLPTAFVVVCAPSLNSAAKSVKLEQDPLRRRAAAIYRERGKLQRAKAITCCAPCPFQYSTAFKPLRRFPAPKQRAIRQLNYDSSTKVLAITKRRFWETDDGIFGGGTYTDYRPATNYYPADNAAAKDPRVSAAPGVMLASYSWGQSRAAWVACRTPSARTWCSSI